MRTQFELDQFNEILDGTPQSTYLSNCFESCIPRSFWEVSSASVTANLGVFNVVLKYCAKRRRVQKKGWSLLFMGDNGVGKTTFVTFVLSQMLKRGCTVYYTTLATLDKDIKSGFGDKDAERRLDQYLNSEFLAIDELGKEHYRNDSFLNTRLESLLKQRCDDGDPTLLATNLEYKTFESMYGPSISSIMEGRYLKLAMKTGDHRKLTASSLKKDLGL